MDTLTRHKVVYLILASIMLYVLYFVNYRISVLVNPTSSAIVSFSFFSVIAIFIITFYPEIIDTNRNITKIDDFIMFISTFTFLAVSISLITGFGTDNMQYIYQAMNYFISGKDPYEMKYYPFSVGPTYLINGNIASNYIYPPFSFLIYLPFFLLIKLVNGQGFFINIINVIFDVILILLIYNEGRKKQDPLSVLSAIILYILLAIAVPPFFGVNVAIPSTLLLISYLRDDKFGGVSLGLATSFTQLSWLAIPFLLIYKIKNKINVREYILAFVITISLINTPFIIWNYKAFLYNVFTTDINTIPVGDLGLTVINYSGLFPVEPWFFTFSEALVTIFLVYVYFKFFEIIKNTLWIYPLVISWFLWRALTEYFFLWIPLLFVVIYRTDAKLTKAIKLNIRRDLIIPFSVIFLLLLSVGSYAHETYVSSNPIRIVYVEPLGKMPFSSLLIEVKNVGSKPINITLVRVSLPNNLNMVWNFTYSLVPPNSTSILFAYAPFNNETINSTTFTVEVYSYYYFATYKVNTTNITY